VSFPFLAGRWLLPNAGRQQPAPQPITTQYLLDTSRASNALSNRRTVKKKGGGRAAAGPPAPLFL